MLRKTLFAFLALILVSASARSQTWKTLDLVDEFGDATGEVAAVSEYANGNMTFPYNQIRARLMVRCDDVWIRFSDSPNLASGTLRVKLDDGPRYRRTVRKSPGSTDLDFSDNLDVIEDLMQGTRIRIVFDWYQQRTSLFEWKLSGSSDAIIRSCGGYDPVERAQEDKIKKAAADDMELLSEIRPLIEDFHDSTPGVSKKTKRYRLAYRIRALHTLPEDIRRFRDSEIGVLSDESKDGIERIEEIQQALTNMESSPLAGSIYAKPILELREEAKALADGIMKSGDIVPTYLIEMLNEYR